MRSLITRLALIAALATPTSLVLAQAAPARGGANAPAPAAGTGGAPILSPEFAEAFDKLTAAEFAEREQAIARLQQLLGRQVRQSIALQQVLLRVQQDLSAQLRALTGRASADAESDARVAGLLEFNMAVSRWASECMSLPAAERDAMLAWGSSDAVLPLIGQLYGRSVDSRMQAVRDLAKLQGNDKQVNLLLTQLINDPERAVSLTAMDVLYYRPADPAIIEAVWNRAMGPLQLQVRNIGQPSRARVIVVAERSVQVYDAASQQPRNQADLDVAADLLIKFKDPAIGERLDQFFVELGRSMTSSNDSRWRTITPSYGGSASQFIGKLLDAYQPKQAVRFFARTLESSSNDGGDSTYNINGQQVKVRMSSRVDAAQLFVRLTGQDAEDYGLMRLPNYSPERWAVKGTAVEEQEMIKKLQTWWKEHEKDFGADLP